ncbi:hypothetical protein CVT26_012678 [Gymnopilus dilepis]|uniref:Uncharacterized protein n=1 Tax=Gymnopilus dilepis TaxID=231916 RepID=A0A409WAS7_9AGAR|nr:hypothetical protein CVT26_012678 [Gymnopilus dilepis]
MSVFSSLCPGGVSVGVVGIRAPLGHFPLSSLSIVNSLLLSPPHLPRRTVQVQCQPAVVPRARQPQQQADPVMPLVHVPGAFVHLLVLDRSRSPAMPAQPAAVSRTVPIAARMGFHGAGDRINALEHPAMPSLPPDGPTLNLACDTISGKWI